MTLLATIQKTNQKKSSANQIIAMRPFWKLLSILSPIFCSIMYLCKKQHMAQCWIKVPFVPIQAEFLAFQCRNCMYIALIPMVPRPMGSLLQGYLWPCWIIMSMMPNAEWGTEFNGSPVWTFPSLASRDRWPSSPQNQKIVVRKMAAASSQWSAEK